MQSKRGKFSAAFKAEVALAAVKRDRTCRIRRNSGAQTYSSKESRYIYTKGSELTPILNVLSLFITIARFPSGGNP